MAAILAYVAGTVVAAWGVAHAVPTWQATAGFSADHGGQPAHRAPGVTDGSLHDVGVAAVVLTVTAVGNTGTAARVWVYRIAAGLLLALGTLPALTGARTAVVSFKIRPVLLADSAALLLAGSFLQEGMLSGPGCRSGCPG